jgi:glycosyltransferase involved in cell wall biosynthesis
MKLSLVITTLNEIEGLRILFDKIPYDSVDEIIAVDGGSTDGTVEFLKERNIPTYVQTLKGRGEGFRLAFEKAAGDALLFFSPDGNEDPNDIPKFKPFLELGYDMVVATRMIKGAHNEEDDYVLKWRKWANNSFSVMANYTWNKGIYMTDTINGFRAISKRAWNLMSVDGPGYTVEFQSSIRAFKLGLKIAEFPTYESGRFDNRVGSPSIPTGIAFLKMYFSEINRAPKLSSASNKAP